MLESKMKVKIITSITKQRKIFSLLFLIVFLERGIVFVDAAGYRMPIGSPIGQKLAQATAGQWVKLNINKYKDVWVPLDQRPAPPEAPSVGSPHSIILAWSSMAWDANRGKLIFFGGGHANYPGNEIYLWNAQTLKWERGSLPSDVELSPIANRTYSFSFVAVDGHFNAPVAAHTYDNSEFFPIVDRFITFGGAAFNTGHFFELTDGKRTGPYLWNPSRADPNKVGGTTGSNVNFINYSEVLGGQMWSNRNNLEPEIGEGRPGVGGTDFINGATAYAEFNGKDSLFIETIGDLYRYTINDINDPTQDDYQKVGDSLTTFAGQGAGAYDPSRKLFVRTAGKQFVFWELSNPGANNLSVIFEPTVIHGSFDFTKLANFGIDYDTKRKVFTLWDGNSSVWNLIPPEDLQTGTWKLSEVIVNSAEAPTTAAISFTGILGKWKYIRSLDVFLGVFDPQAGDIWAYKPQGWDPLPADNVPPYIISPQENSFHWRDNDLTINAVVDDFDNSITNVEFFKDGVKLGEATSFPYTITITNPLVGKYTIIAVATDNGGSVSSIPVHFVVTSNNPVIQTKVLQDGLNGYDSTEDVYLSQFQSDHNLGSTEYLLDKSSGSKNVSLIRFAIFQSEGGEIPDGSYIESATLSLYKFSAYDSVYLANPILQNWQETEATWNERLTGVPWVKSGATGLGSDFAMSEAGESAVRWDPQWLDLDVASSVQAMSDGIADNYGWRLYPISGNTNTKDFHSREYSNDFSLRPKLTIEYRVVQIEEPKKIGDLNNDGKVSFADLNLFKLTFGKNISDAGYNSDADFNGDGKVSFHDLAIFKENFGK